MARILLNEVFKSSVHGGDLELAFSHLFVGLESRMRGMVDKDLLKNNSGKINVDNNDIKCL